MKAKKEVGDNFQRNMPLVKNPFTFGGHVPQGFFGSDVLDDDLVEGEVA